jgi:hypothetical protein
VFLGLELLAFLLRRALASLNSPGDLQGCFVAILLLLFQPLKAISVSPGLLAATSSAGTPTTESDSEGSDMSDRDEAGFHGQVKTCIEETVYPPGRQILSHDGVQS